jgi:hypothetical protein
VPSSILAGGGTGFITPSPTLFGVGMSSTSAETAFAKSNDDEDASCFLDITDLDNVVKQKGGRPSRGKNGSLNAIETKEAKFDRWGWTNKFEFINSGIHYATLPMYAGAAQCDLCKGSFVGNVDLVFSASTLIVTYQVLDKFLMEGVHLHVGGSNEEKVPSVNDVYTVAPGQYGCGTHTDNEDYCVVSSSTNTKSVFQAMFVGVPETFYIIAHATVSGTSDAFSDSKGDEC